MPRIFYFTALSATLLFTSCGQQESDYSFWTDNKTQDTLQVRVVNLQSNPTETIEYKLAPGATRKLKSVFSQGRSDDWVKSMDFCDSIIVSRNGRNSDKIFVNRSEWDFKALNESNAEYRLKLDSTDF